MQQSKLQGKRAILNTRIGLKYIVYKTDHYSSEWKRSTTSHVEEEMIKKKKKSAGLAARQTLFTKEYHMPLSIQGQYEVNAKFISTPTK